MALDLLKLEYQSLREESAQARAAQQQILQWSLATFAAFFAAGIVLVAQDKVSITSGTAGSVYLVVLGLALPGLVIASSWAWMGELIRMERAGHYLRGLERSVSVQLGTSPAPLRWETHIALGAVHGGSYDKLLAPDEGPPPNEGRPEQHEHPEGTGRGKQQLGYVGSAGLYAGVLLLSLVLFFMAWQSHQWDTDTPSAVVYGWLVVEGLFLVIFSGAGLMTKKSLKAIGRDAARLWSLQPRAVNYPLNKRRHPTTGKALE